MNEPMVRTQRTTISARKNVLICIASGELKRRRFASLHIFEGKRNLMRVWAIHRRQSRHAPHEHLHRVQRLRGLQTDARPKKRQNQSQQVYLLLGDPRISESDAAEAKERRLRHEGRVRRINQVNATSRQRPNGQRVHECLCRLELP